LLTYIKLLTGASETRICWQLIHDREHRVLKPVFAAYHEIRDWLNARNQEGFGIYVAVGETADAYRINATMLRPRAFFPAFDEKQLFSHWGTTPDFISQRGSDHSHVYWVLPRDSSLDWALWRQVQKGLIDYYGSDPAIKDPARIMRVPGTWHHKDPHVI